METKKKMSLISLGVSLKEKNLLPQGANSYLKSSSSFGNASKLIKAN